MMTIPPELIDFIRIANVTCTECVRQVNPTQADPAAQAYYGAPEHPGQPGPCEERCWSEPARMRSRLPVSAGRTVRAEFEDCTVMAGPDTTTLRAELPDQTALWGLVERIMSLGLEVVHLHLVAPESR